MLVDSCHKYDTFIEKANLYSTIHEDHPVFAEDDVKLCHLVARCPIPLKFWGGAFQGFGTPWNVAMDNMAWTFVGITSQTVNRL